MKQYFSKAMKQLMFLTFAVFVMAGSFSGISQAAPQKVENVRQSDSSAKSVEVSWEKILSGVDKYKVYLSEERDFPVNNTITEKTVTNNYDSKWFFGLNPNRTYYVKVAALNSSGVEFAVSDVITCVTKPDTVPKTYHTESTVSSVTIAWDAPFSGAEYYKVYYKPVNSSVNPIYAGTTANKSFTVSGLADDTQYHMYVYAVRKSASGYEAISDDKSSAYNTTIAKANRFSQIKLNKWEAGTAKAVITFKSAASFEQSGIELEIRSLSGKKIKTVKANQYASQFTFSSGKIKNKGFKYRLRYYVTTDTKTCYGPYTKEKVVVAQPKATAKKKSNSSVTLKWNKISGAKSYSVYIWKEDKFKKAATVKSTSCTLKNLKPRTDYYIYVKANGVKSGNKKYSSTKPVNRSVTEIWYSDHNSYISNYYKTITK